MYNRRYDTLCNLVKQKTDGKEVYCVDYKGLRLYFSDGIIYLPDGRGFEAGMVNPDKLRITEYIIDAEDYTPERYGRQYEEDVDSAVIK